VFGDIPNKEEKFQTVCTSPKSNATILLPGGRPTPRTHCRSLERRSLNLLHRPFVFRNGRSAIICGHIWSPPFFELYPTTIIATWSNIV